MSKDQYQLRRQYEAERELGDRIRQSTRAERPELLRHLYAELRKRAPSHPRLSGDANSGKYERVEAQMRLLRPWINGNPGVFLEFAPGAGHLAAEMCRHAGRVIAVDISRQLSTDQAFPGNFNFLIYDGYKLDLPDNSVDMAFSYQMIEHIHPEDVPLHFQMAWRLLRPGGIYLFATPHRFSGPHDISRHFSDVPRGLHLKEWSYKELIPILDQTGFSNWHICRRGRYIPRPARATLRLESFFNGIPTRLRRRLSRRIFAGIVMAARKMS